MNVEQHTSHPASRKSAYRQLVSLMHHHHLSLSYKAESTSVAGYMHTEMVTQVEKISATMGTFSLSFFPSLSSFRLPPCHSLSFPLPFSQVQLRGQGSAVSFQWSLGAGRALAATHYVIYWAQERF